MIENKENNETQQYTTSIEQIPSNVPSYEFSWGGYIKALSTLFFILAIVVFCMILLKRKGSPSAISNALTSYFSKSKNPQKRKELPLLVEQRYSIDQRKSLLVVQFLNKRLLLGVTDASIQVLDECLDEGKSIHEQNVASFQAHLAQVEHKEL